ncbi:OmpA/MotB family protein [Acidithrix ferrooxidans]|uniref:Motility protein B n=1 Tax=Acidithrix ferrooxidans TaxID=1280514 RepID=A0A0D8HF54_9ACTN|nr:flagellar motor protein MotB [Acidithrix ferrooxidans]KJF16553.1 motility protein B [Acidithrix ferrooxidans]
MSVKGHTAPALHRGKKKHEEEVGEHSERWLLTYADMITLLLALFVVLFAMSSISVKKFNEFRTGVISAFSPQINSLQAGGTGILQANSLISSPGNSSAKATISSSSNSSSSNATVSLERQLSRSIASSGLSSSVSVLTSSQGVIVRILTDKVFFAVDSANVQPGGTKILDAVASVIAPIPNNVVIQGNTDNQPIVGGPYSSNMELSAMRAVNVLEYLVKNDHILASRLSATGYGSTRPLLPNTTPANMMENRRVDILILNTTISTSLSSTATSLAPTLTTLPNLG